jgi:hypothetical protein
MTEIPTIEGELEKIITVKVQRGSYPAPVPLTSDTAQRKELEDLRAERIPRPSPKMAYLARLKEIEDEIADIRDQNARIRSENDAGRKVVDNQYTADLASARMDEVNIAAALCKCIEYQLQRTAWYVIRDSNLSPEQQTIADEWRQEMMTLVTEETKIGDAVQRYTALIDEKPEYDLRWKKSTSGSMTRK